MPSFVRRSLAAAMCMGSVMHGVSALTTATPETVGLSTQKLQAMMTNLQNQVTTGQLPGATVTIIRGGSVVFESAVGAMDRELNRPMTADTIVRLMSMSKPVTAAAVMKLVEQGKLSLDDPLSKFHHKFRRIEVDAGNGQTVPAEREITIRDLLLHTAGLGYGAGLGGNNGGNQITNALSMLQLPYTSLQDFMDDLAKQPLIAQPGTKWAYSWAYDVLGYVIQKISHKEPDEYMRDELFGPLGMQDTDFYVPAAKLSRFAACYTLSNNALIPVFRPYLDPLLAYRPVPFISGGSGLVSTARDYARFGQMLVNGGEIDGVRILQPETVDMMWRNQLTPNELPINLNGWTSDANTGWGFGFTISTATPVKDVDWSTHTGEKRTGIVGWGGGMMTNWIASKELDMVVIFMTQRLASPLPNTFQEVVVTGVLQSITGPSKPTPTTAPSDSAQADVGADGSVSGGSDEQDGGDDAADGDSGNGHGRMRGGANNNNDNNSSSREERKRKRKERKRKHDDDVMTLAGQMIDQQRRGGLPNIVEMMIRTVDLPNNGTKEGSASALDVVDVLQAQP